MIDTDPWAVLATCHTSSCAQSKMNQCATSSLVNTELPEIKRPLRSCVEEVCMGCRLAAVRDGSAIIGLL